MNNNKWITLYRESLAVGQRVRVQNYTSTFIGTVFAFAVNTGWGRVEWIELQDVEGINDIIHIDLKNAHLYYESKQLPDKPGAVIKIKGVLYVKNNLNWYRVYDNGYHERRGQPQVEDAIVRNNGKFKVLYEGRR